MSCACRTAPWRTFVRGLAQVHKLEASGLHPALPLRPAGARPAIQQQSWAASRLVNRTLHTPRHRNQDAGATAGREHEESAPVTPAPSGDAIKSGPLAAKSEETASKKKYHTKKDYSKKDYTKKDYTKKGNKPKFFVKGDGSKTSSTFGTARDAQPKATGGWKTKQKTDRIDASPEEMNVESNSQKGRWQAQKAALKEKFPEGWKPRKRLSPDALEGIRALNAQFPDVYTTDALAGKFQVSPEVIRRILKSTWRPSAEQEEDRQDRWFRRGMRVWEQKAALGIKPPTRWRREGIARDPGYHEWSKRASQREREWEEDEVRKYKAYREGVRRREAGNDP